MKKIYFTLILILALVFSLVIVSNATSVMYNTSDSALEDMIQEDSNSNNADLMIYTFVGSFVNYGNVPNGNFTIYIQKISSYENDSYESYIYWVSDVEAFQNRYNGYTYNSFIAELENYNYGETYYQLAYMFSSESAFNYFMSWEPSVSQVQFDRLAQEYSTLEQTYKQLVISNNTLQSEYNTLQDSNNTLQSNYNTLVNDFNTLRVNNEALQSEYNTLQSEYNTLQSEYNTLESTISVVRQEGYNQGLEDADALSNGLGVILSAPVYFLNNVFNFEILGFSMRSIFATIITVLTIAWVTKKLSY